MKDDAGAGGGLPDQIQREVVCTVWDTLQDEKRGPSEYVYC